MQAPAQDNLAASIQLVLSGHIHLFQAIDFGGGRPSQFVVGESGTLLSRDVTDPLVGVSIGGAPIADATVFAQFGFVTIESDGAGWTAIVREVSGAPMATCSIQVQSTSCVVAGVN